MHTLPQHPRGTQARPVVFAAAHMDVTAPLRTYDGAAQGQWARAQQSVHVHKGMNGAS